jgi:von Willebrand factor type A domain-containing protein
MIDRQRIATYGIATTATATIALALWLKPWASGSLTTPIEPTEKGHRIDMVFAIDTTGSMGGLIDGAKRTVWSIASHVRDVDPQADLHVGLVAYRDLGDEYVTKDFALTSDMDAVFAQLSSFQAAGGGDIPEDVDAALDDAVHKMQWRDGAKKMIFLVGDAPPASRGDVPRFDVSARDAADQQIIINTIRCGQMPETAQSWQQIASIGRGDFSTIEQNGGVQQMATPYDDKMAELSRTVDSTAVIYGDKDAHAAYEGAMAATAAAPAATKADRAAYYAAKPAKGGSRSSADITAGVAGGSVDVGALDESKLPAELQGKSKEEIKAEIDARAKKRDEAQKELAKVAKEREQYLKEHKDSSSGFDATVKATVDRELK